MLSAPLLLRGATFPKEDRLRPAADESATGSDFCLNCSAFMHEFADSLGQTVDARDRQTYSHSQQVAELALRLAHVVGLPAAQGEAIHIAGHLHDIGKIGIPDAILKKEGPLSETEWHWMKRHPEIGARILKPVRAFRGIGGMSDIVLCHHERFDGKGYPNGLSGRKIPVGARIMAVADTLSALLEDRPYRRGTSIPAALNEIMRCSGTQFDPAVVEALLQIWEEGELAGLLLPSGQPEPADGDPQLLREFPQRPCRTG